MSLARSGLLPERAGVAAPAGLAERRAAITAAREAGLWATEPSPETLIIDGVRALRFASAASPRATMLHMHGGGFRIGCPEIVAPFAAKLAERCSIEVICPAYRPAPEHPFPAGLNDGWKVLASLAGQTAGPLLLSGDSAGGALAVGLTAMALRHEVPIGGLALLSPWLDLTNSNPCFEANRHRDAVFSKEDADEAAASYLQGLAPRDPVASAAFCDPANFPATYLNVGEGEVLVDDAAQFADRLKAAGVATLCDIVPNMEHVAMTRDLALPGAAESFAALVAFIDDALNTD